MEFGTQEPLDLAALEAWVSWPRLDALESLTGAFVMPSDADVLTTL